MTHYFRVSREPLDELRNEIAELRASRERLVRAADADRRRLERDLHDGVQQQLVALAVNLQRVSTLADADPVAAKALLGEIGRDVQEALDAAGRLAHGIYPPLLEAGGLAAALRSAAMSAGISARIEVEAGASYPPEVAGALYFCCLEVLEHAPAGAPVTVMVHGEGGAVAFEAGPARPDVEVERLRDRVEALGGRLAIESDTVRGSRLSGCLPLSR
jgi:signal transduction histidine kinase